MGLSNTAAAGVSGIPTGKAGELVLFSLEVRRLGSLLAVTGKLNGHHMSVAPLCCPRGRDGDEMSVGCVLIT